MSEDDADFDPNAPPLFLTEVDKQVLAQTDEEYHYHTWEELKQIISENRLETLKRKPSDLRKYLAWLTRIKATYGNITNYVLQERLHWIPLPPIAELPASDQVPTFKSRNPHPFADPDDYCILKNDWPYGLENGILHLVIWLKTPISVKPDTGEITDTGRAIVEKWIDTTFVQRLMQAGHTDGGNSSREKALNKVLWFKNWTRLQSVRGLDHIHVLLRDIPEALQNEWMK
ncbi:hypothetical protein EV356DRAFT_470554 [Viridothelium virens]|uniref:N-acetylglucosamine-induced protein 1 n=1 Tax=Viridothelium virens TaxID=1048519 RepID=A0A6A6H2Y6_VIRVR|nr:hypothetical protein EV356DRAFT_470554 [Viridothelium virens]